jgi:hypothetical protein
MTARTSTIDRRLLDRARERHAGDPVTVLVGGCGCGRTERLRRLQHALGDDACQYVDLERVSTTPERCYQTVVRHSPFACAAGARPATAREAWDALLAFFMSAHGADGSPATFLLDEVLEVRTFESFPGLRAALPELARALAHSPNHFVLSTRFTARAERWALTVRDRFELVPIDPLAVADVREALVPSAIGNGERVPPHDPDPYAADHDEVARAVHALVGGRPGYVRSLVNLMASVQTAGVIDPISALAASLASDGELAARCRFSYELRLHRARGYGALKAILDVLADVEPLTLTAIAQRLERTPGSTKDYLSWLQDVDLISCTRKRYRFTDPILRLWVRLHGGPAAPDDERVAIEVQTYAMDRLREMDETPAPAASATTPAATVSSPAMSEPATPPSAAPERGAEPPRPAPDRPAPERPVSERPGSERAVAAAAAVRTIGSGIIEID